MDVAGTESHHGRNPMIRRIFYTLVGPDGYEVGGACRVASDDVSGSGHRGVIVGHSVGVGDGDFLAWT